MRFSSLFGDKNDRNCDPQENRKKDVARAGLFSPKRFFWCPRRVQGPFKGFVGVSFGCPLGGNGPPVPRKRVRNVPGIVPGTPFGRRRGFWVDCGSMWGRFGVDFRSMFGRFSVDPGSVFERSGRPGVAFILLFPSLSLIGATVERSIDRFPGGLE